MDVCYEGTYLVDARDTGLCNQCRPSGILSILQEAATMAGAELGVARREMLEKYNAIWMVARMWYRLNRPLGWGERVTVRTWHRGDKGVSCYRDFDLEVDGRSVGEAVSIWVLADVDTRRLIRMSRIEEFAGTDGGSLRKDRLLGKVRVPEKMVLAGVRRFYYSDTDSNGHVNNVKYADYICDALEMEQLVQDCFVSSFQVGYQRECRAGEEVSLYTGRADGTLFVHGVDGGGTTRFDGVLTLDKIAP